MSRFNVGTAVTLDSPYGEYRMPDGTRLRNGVRGTVEAPRKTSGVRVRFDGQTQASAVPEHWLGTAATPSARALEHPTV